MFALEDVRSTALAVEAANKVLAQRVGLFYTPRWYCFDNFSAFSVMFDGRLYPTAEHAYQARKFVYYPTRDGAEAIAEIIRTSPSAYEAKKLGNQSDVADLVREDWDQVKLGLMNMIIRAKWEQHKYIQRKLAETKGLLLVEDSPSDSFWGRGRNWTGQNHLGRIWMELRDEVCS